MIKECKVLFYNPFLNIVVVDFEGLHIQLTGKIDEGAETICVKYENGIATIVSKETYDKSSKTKVDKKSKKAKITETDLVDEVVKSEAVKEEAHEKSECIYCS